MFRRWQTTFAKYPAVTASDNIQGASAPFFMSTFNKSNTYVEDCIRPTVNASHNYVVREVFDWGIVSYNGTMIKWGDIAHNYSLVDRHFFDIQLDDLSKM